MKNKRPPKTDILGGNIKKLSMANSNREPKVFQTSPESEAPPEAYRRLSVADESPTIPVDVVADDDSLSDDERADRERLEEVVEKSVFDAGRALKELKDRRLYRDRHSTFEDYCRERFGYLSRRHPYRLIEAAEIVDNLAEKCDQFGHIREGLILPTTESQVRPLKGLEPEEQYNAWLEATREVVERVPPARVVKDIVQRIREKTNVPNPYRVGDVCQIVVKENPDLRGRGGAWCIVSEVHALSRSVDTWDGQLQLGIQNLKDIEYSPEQLQRVRECRERLYKLHGFYTDKTVRGMLEIIGKSASPYLSGIEEKLLACLETELETFNLPLGSESNGKREGAGQK